MREYTEIKTIEPACGSVINSVVELAIIQAIREGCIIKFKFNGVILKVYACSDLKEVIQNYHTEMSKPPQKKKSKIKRLKKLVKSRLSIAESLTARVVYSEVLGMINEAENAQNNNYKL